MAVIVKYIVERNGIEKMTFTSKKEADAYDKQLDISENLFAFLETSGIGIDEDKLEEICFFLAQHNEQVVPLLKGAKPKPAGAAKPKLEAEPTNVDKAAAKPNARAKPKEAAAS